MPKCHFCGTNLPKGTGVMYVLKDGTAYWYCSRKCEKNAVKLKRSSGKTGWTAAHFKEKVVAGRSR